MARHEKNTPRLDLCPAPGVRFMPAIFCDAKTRTKAAVAAPHSHFTASRPPPLRRTQLRPASRAASTRFFRCVCMRCVNRSAVGSSWAASVTGKICRAVRTTASWPSTSWRIISSAGGTPSASGIDDSFANSYSCRAPQRPVRGCVRRSNRLPAPARCNLRLEHQMQRIEHRTRHVPVKVMGLQIQRVRIGEQMRQPVCDLLPVLVADTDVDVRYGCFFAMVTPLQWNGTAGRIRMPGRQSPDRECPTV